MPNGGRYAGLGAPGGRDYSQEGTLKETKIARRNSWQLRLSLLILYLSACCVWILLRYVLLPRAAILGGVAVIGAAALWWIVYSVAWGMYAERPVGWATIYVVALGFMLVEIWARSGYAPAPWQFKAGLFALGFLIVVVAGPEIPTVMTYTVEIIDRKWPPPSTAIERTQPILPIQGILEKLFGDDGELAPEPMEPHVRAEIVSNQGRSMELEAKIPVAPEDLRKVALAVLRGDPFSEPGLEKAIGGGDYRKLKADFIQRDFVAWVDDDNHRLGVEVTSAGEQFLRQYVQQTRGEHVIRLPE